jgi:hypothetical protein
MIGGKMKKNNNQDMKIAQLESRLELALARIEQLEKELEESNKRSIEWHWHQHWDYQPRQIPMPVSHPPTGIPYFPPTFPTIWSNAGGGKIH